MPETRICAACQKPYDPTRFGAGKKYCNPKCYYLWKGRTRFPGSEHKTDREILNRRRGRPRKYPVQTVGHEIVILHDLHHCLGVKTTPCPDTKTGTPIEFLHVGDRGTLRFKIAIGSSNKRAVSLADVVMYLNDQGDIQIVSACDQGRRYVPQEHKGSSLYLRAPCGRCYKCHVSNVLYLARRENTRKEIEAKKDLPPVPDLSII